MVRSGTWCNIIWWNISECMVVFDDFGDFTAHCSDQSGKHDNDWNCIKYKHDPRNRIVRCNLLLLQRKCTNHTNYASCKKGKKQPKWQKYSSTARFLVQQQLYITRWTMSRPFQGKRIWKFWATTRTSQLNWAGSRWNNLPTHIGMATTPRACNRCRRFCANKQTITVASDISFSIGRWF